MSRWSRFNRGNCPVCAGSRKDCRQNQDTNLIHCRSASANPRDWIFRGEDAWGFGMWAYAPDAEAWTHEKREEWRREQDELKRERQCREQEQRERSLSATERDREIRKILSQLTLSDRHLQLVIKRGLTDAQIEQNGYRSIAKWQKLDDPVSNRLAGTSLNGNKLNNPCDGILCPVTNSDGQYIGMRLHNPQSQENGIGKYIWLSSSRRNVTNHDQNGENPIAVYYPEKYKHYDRIGLCEGLEFKSAIAANQLGYPVIGFSGCNFGGSPKALELAIASIRQKLVKEKSTLPASTGVPPAPHSLTFVLLGDGGCVLNKQVTQGYAKVARLLKTWNYLVQYAWWGQVQKSDGDIDEINSDTFSKIEHLSSKEFSKLAKKERYIQQQWSKWSNYKKFTSQIKIKKKFVEYGLPQKDTITFIKSGLGSGKTTETINNLLQVQKYGIIGLGYRNALLLQFNEKAQKIGFYHLQSDKNLREFSLDDPGVKVTNCIDSLIHYVKEQFDGKIIIIDEIISVLKHFLFSATIKQFSKVKELFTEMVNRCDRMICLDGFMQDWAVTFFKELCPSKQIVTIENIYQGDKAKVYLLEGTIDIDERVRANDKTPWTKKLLDSDCPSICSDSQIFCEAIENLLLEQGRAGIRVDSKTVGQQHVKEFFTDPDKYIQQNQPEYLIYSPTAESGLDVPIENYFSEHFAFFFGQLDVDSIIQMLGRIRDVNVPEYVWCKKFIVPEDTKRRPSNVESIQADRARALMSELHSTLNSIESPEAKIARIQKIYQDNLDPYTTVADTITAIRNHEFSNYRECLKQQLIDSGYPVIAVTLEFPSDATAALSEQEKEAKTEVKKQNANNIFNASDKYIGKNQINLGFDATWETRCAVMKADLVRKLTGINYDPVWSPEFIKLVKYDKPNLINQNRLYYLMDNLDLAKQLSLEKYNGIFNRGSIAAPWKLRQEYSKVKALRDIGIYDFIQAAIDNPDFTYTADSPSVKAILDKCRWKKNRGSLGTPGKDPIKFINKLLRSVGIETKAKKLKRQGKANWVYLIDQKHLLSEERLAILRAIQLKYKEKNNSNNQPLEWVANDENLAKNRPIQKSPLKIAETIDTQDLDQVADPPDIYINNSMICHPLNNHQSLANLPTEINNTNQIQNSLDCEDARVFDTPSAIAELADWLSQLENAEQLAALLEVPELTSRRLNRAARRLAFEQQRLIRQWAIENRDKGLTA